jgi:hypothetical protein
MQVVLDFLAHIIGTAIGVVVCFGIAGAMMLSRITKGPD